VNSVYPNLPFFFALVNAEMEGAIVVNAIMRRVEGRLERTEVVILSNANPKIWPKGSDTFPGGEECGR